MFELDPPPGAELASGMPIAPALCREHVEYVLRIADTSLVLGQRLAEWCGHAPVLEEDIALANVALDLFGQARLLLAHAGRIEGRGRGEDDLAFLRSDREFRNPTLVELPNGADGAGNSGGAPGAPGDFARTVLRNLLVAAWQVPLWAGLRGSSDAALAAIASKCEKETRYHLRHAADWTIRLGDGTPVSHARAASALRELWPYTAELFASDAVDAAAVARGIGPDWASLRPAWTATVLPVLAEATLEPPPATPFRSHGRSGRHSEHLGHLLAEMQVLPRTYPGARW